jgi:hypothetical protein
LWCVLGGHLTFHRTVRGQEAGLVIGAASEKKKNGKASRITRVAEGIHIIEMVDREKF